MAETVADYWASQLTWPEPAKPEDVQGPVPDLTPEERDELIALIHPLRIERDGRWVVVPTDLVSLRAARVEYRRHIDQQALEDFKGSAAYRRAAIAAEREREDQRADRRAEQQRQPAELVERRYRELIAAGVNPLEAAQLAEQQRG